MFNSISAKFANDLIIHLENNGYKLIRVNGCDCFDLNESDNETIGDILKDIPFESLLGLCSSKGLNNE
jgi:hypothetical protein